MCNCHNEHLTVVGDLRDSWTPSNPSVWMKLSDESVRVIANCPDQIKVQAGMYEKITGRCSHHVDL